MLKEIPSNYMFIKSLEKVGFNAPLDRKWTNICAITDSASFIKHHCECISKDKIEKNIEVILKQYCSSNKKVTNILYVGQCCRCETIYWCEESSE